MRWIKSHRLVVFLTVLVLASVVITSFSVSRGGRADPVSKYLNNALTAAEKPFVKLSRTIYDNISGIYSYKKYQKENEDLRKENAELKRQVTALSLSARELAELKELSSVLNYELPDAESSLITANITSTLMSRATWMSSFTIDRGIESGIESGDIVVYGSALIGRVVDAGKNWAKVNSIIDESNKASFSVSGKLGLIGVVEDSEDGILNGFMIDNTANIEEDDALITSGLGIYPAGLMIGKITKIKYDRNSQLLRIKVKPAVDFKLLQKVSVIM